MHKRPWHVEDAGRRMVTRRRKSIVFAVQIVMALSATSSPRSQMEQTAAVLVVLTRFKMSMLLACDVSACVCIRIDT